MKMLPVLCCGPDVEPLDPMASETLAARFRALSDPTRVAIVNRLASTEECCVCDLNAAFELSQPTISHHLKVLRDAGLVESSRRGTWAYYRLVPDAVEELRPLVPSGATLAQLSLRWILMHEAVSTVIPGARSPEQAQANAAAADVAPLDDGAMARVAEVYRERIAPFVHQRW